MNNTKNEIVMGKMLNDKQHEDVNVLENISFAYDGINLKLELDYKKSLHGLINDDADDVNEFLYYVDDTLVAYVGICSFGLKDTAEINGMVHPNYRRKGIFKKLLSLAVDECKKRNFDTTLLLSDSKSVAGIKAIEPFDAQYKTTEYRMRREGNTPIITRKSITLREATLDDAPEIWKQDAILFNKEVEYSDELAVEILEPAENMVTYLILHNGETIGKIKVEYNEDTAFIFGFGIMPEYRSNGYGREALKETLNIIIGRGIYISELDVECNNDHALNLYKSCGFEEVSSMNYYEYKIDE